MQEKQGFVQHSLIKAKKIEARAYQVRLANNVIASGNSLVVAPTALGKTMVAVLVAADSLEKEKEGKILFLAPTKPLCQQHQKTMQGLMKLPREKIPLLTGSVAMKKRKLQWEQAAIVVATPQTIENDLRKRRISLNSVSLVIFDEAHRAVGDYAYVFIARKYVQQNPEGLILGLTASPGGREQHIKEVCSSLFIKNIEIKSLADEDVKPYSHEIKLEWRVVELPGQFREIMQLLERFMQKQIAVLNRFGFSRARSTAGFGKKRLLEMQERIRREIQRKGARQPSLFAAATAVAALLKASHAHMLLETQGTNSLHGYFERAKEKQGKEGSRALRQFLASPDVQQAMQLAEGLREKQVNHPKLALLQEILQKQFEIFPESRCIVFNHYRDSIKQLVQQLNSVGGIRAERFVGQAAKGKEKGMSQKEQAEKIKELKAGKINCLVASSVAEEGLDIPSVDLVVFYEPVPSEIRYIQRRGRTGRLAAGRAIILMAKGTRDEAFYWVSVRKEQKMHRTLRKMQREKAEAIGTGAEGKAGARLKGKAVGAEWKASGMRLKGHLVEAELKAHGTRLKGKAAGTRKGEKQTTLHSFSNPGNDEIVVYADAREQDAGVVQLLQELGCQVVVKQLGVGDYIAGKDTAVERKTVQDFLSSIVDGRLPQQLMALAESYERPIVLVEGDIDELFTSRNIHRNAVIGMLTSIALNYRIPLLFTDSVRETAQYIFVIAKREQLGKGSDVRLRVGRKGMTLQQQQQFIVESLPLIGPQMAKKLLGHFGSVQAIVNADERQLQQVDNLGKEKARKIKRVLLSKWGEK